MLQWKTVGAFPKILFQLWVSYWNKKFGRVLMLFKYAFICSFLHSHHMRRYWFDVKNNFLNCHKNSTYWDARSKTRWCLRRCLSLCRRHSLQARYFSIESSNWIEILKNFVDKTVHLKKIYKFTVDYILIGHVVFVLIIKNFIKSEKFHFTQNLC